MRIIKQESRQYTDAECVIVIQTALKKFVETPSPSGYEHDAQKLVRERVKPWCDEVKTDVMGNVFGIRNPSGKPRIMLAGHCDQIGFIVQYITEEGFLFVEAIGGVDPTVAVSQRVSIMANSGLIPGVIGRKAIHLMDEDDRKRVPKMHDLYVDIGVNSKKEALKLVGIGDAGVFVQPYTELANERAVSMAFDNKMGTWIAPRCCGVCTKKDRCVRGRGFNRTGGNRAARRADERLCERSPCGHRTRRGAWNRLPPGSRRKRRAIIISARDR